MTNLLKQKRIMKFGNYELFGGFSDENSIITIMDINTFEKREINVDEKIKYVTKFGMYLFLISDNYVGIYGKNLKHIISTSVEFDIFSILKFKDEIRVYDMHGRYITLNIKIEEIDFDIVEYNDIKKKTVVRSDRNTLLIINKNTKELAYPERIYDKYFIDIQRSKFNNGYALGIRDNVVMELDLITNNALSLNSFDCSIIDVCYLGKKVAVLLENNKVLILSNDGVVNHFTLHLEEEKALSMYSVCDEFLLIETDTKIYIHNFEGQLISSFSKKYKIKDFIGKKQNGKLKLSMVLSNSNIKVNKEFEI